MACESAQFVPAGYVPQLDCVVSASGRERPAIRPECDGGNSSGVAGFDDKFGHLGARGAGNYERAQTGEYDPVVQFGHRRASQGSQFRRASHQCRGLTKKINSPAFGLASVLPQWFAVASPDCRTLFTENVSHGESGGCAWQGME